MKPILYSIVLLFSFTTVSAQTVVQGVVSDKRSNEPLIGANVAIYNGFEGASTDGEGRFSFDTYEVGPQKLLVSYIGYDDLVIDFEVEKDLNLEINLKSAAMDITEVVVTAGSFEASDEKKGAILAPLDIVTIPGANGDITGALNTLPGTTTNGENGRLIVRGGAAYETRVYVDGLPIKNYYSSQAPDVPVRSRFSPFQFKGTTFASGGYSAEYGQALSSALILETLDMPSESTTNISLSSIGVSGGVTRMNDKGAWSVNAGYSNLGPYMDIIKQDIEFTEAPEQGVIAMEGRRKTKNDGIFKFGAQSNYNTVGTRYGSLPWDDFRFEFGLKNTNSRAFAVYRQPLSDKVLLHAATQAEYNKDALRSNDWPSFDVKNTVVSGRVKSVIVPNSRIKWTTGVEYYYNQSNNPFGTDRIYQSLYSGFVEAETFITNDIIIRAGLRLDHDNILEQSKVAPRLTAVLRTGDNAQIAASWGVFYQSPEDSILFNPVGLGMEQAQHYILNYQVGKDGKILRLEAYHKEYDDLIRGDFFNFSNTGDGYARGFELFYRDRTTFTWGDFWVSYSYLDTERIFRSYPIRAQPTFAAKHNASFVYKYFFNKAQIGTSLSYTVQSGRPYFNPGNDNFLSDRTPAYHNLSFQAAKLTNIAGHFTALVVSINNVLGLKQTFTYRFDEIPDSGGQYYRQEIGPPAPSFIFVGAFINIGDRRTKVTKEEALE